MDFLLGVLVLVVGLLVSVAVHELGHLLPAKRFGVRVPQYMVGFGPTVWSRTVGETEYGIKAVPLGGYCRLVGMYPPARRPERARPDSGPTIVAQARAEALAEIRPGEEHRAFYRLSVPRKLVVMASGVAANLLLAAVLLTVMVSAIGVATYTTTLGAVAECVPAEGSGCAPGDPPSPAVAAGLRPGDRVLAWDGRAVTGWEELQATITGSGTGTADVLVERDGTRTTVEVTPTLAERPVLDEAGEPVLDDGGQVVTELRPYVGVSPTAELVRQPLTVVPGMLARAAGATLEAVVRLPVTLVDLTQALLGLEERPTEVMSLIGAGRVAGEIASLDGQGYSPAARVGDMLGLLASLNLALFAFNLIPLPPMDGGQVAGALYEGMRRAVARVRGRADPGPADVARMLPLTYVMVALLLGAAVLLAVADVLAPVSLTG